MLAWLILVHIHSNTYKVLYNRSPHRIFVLLIKKNHNESKEYYEKNISVLNCGLKKIPFYKTKTCKRCIKKCICSIAICWHHLCSNWKESFNVYAARGRNKAETQQIDTEDYITRTALWKDLHSISLCYQQNPRYSRTWLPWTHL